MGGIATVAGVYASQPGGRENRELYYELLGCEKWIQGAEIPYPGELADAQSRAWLAEHVPQSWHGNVITLIPGTMQNLGKKPFFGLASPDEGQRLAAHAFMEDVRHSLESFDKMRKNFDVKFIEIHSAPQAHADKDAMRRSLDRITKWNWCGAKLVIEHCDTYIPTQTPEKGFLALEDEIDIAREYDLGITINWGRSAVEGRSADLPAQHVQQCVDAGVLSGLMFSGAGPEATQYGYEWIDGHLPMSIDEPSSLMTPERIRECVKIALTQENWTSQGYVGVKVCVPADADAHGRADYMKHVYEVIHDEITHSEMSHEVNS